MRGFLWVMVLYAFGAGAFGCARGSFESSGEMRWVFDEGMVYPADRPLSRAEDGVALADGRLVVSDQEAGLRLIEADGSTRAFGRMVEAGYVHRPPGRTGAANGVTLEPGGSHVLVADVYGGGVYRVDVSTEATRCVYRHEFGVNMARRDRRGGLWFTQSARNRPERGEEEVWRAIDLQSEEGAVWYVPPAAPGGSPGAVRVVDGLGFANGIALDEEGGWLYVAETMGSRVLRYRMDVAAGRVWDGRVALEVDHPDNLELDGDGRLWIACPIRSEIVVFDPGTGEARSVFRVSTPESERLIEEIGARLRDRARWLDLMSPSLWEPAPGLMTGMIVTPGGGPVYATGLGDALIRLER